MICLGRGGWLPVTGWLGTLPWLSWKSDTSRNLSSAYSMRWLIWSTVGLHWPVFFQRLHPSGRAMLLFLFSKIGGHFDVHRFSPFVKIVADFKHKSDFSLKHQEKLRWLHYLRDVDKPSIQIFEAFALKCLVLYSVPTSYHAVSHVRFYSTCFITDTFSFLVYWGEQPSFDK